MILIIINFYFFRSRAHQESLCGYYKSPSTIIDFEYILLNSLYLLVPSSYITLPYRFLSLSLGIFPIRFQYLFAVIYCCTLSTCFYPYSKIGPHT